MFAFLARARFDAHGNSIGFFEPCLHDSASQSAASPVRRISSVTSTSTTTSFAFSRRRRVWTGRVWGLQSPCRFWRWPAARELHEKPKWRFHPATPSGTPNTSCRYDCPQCLLKASTVSQSLAPLRTRGPGAPSTRPWCVFTGRRIGRSPRMQPGDSSRAGYLRARTASLSSILDTMRSGFDHPHARSCGYCPLPFAISRLPVTCRRVEVALTAYRQRLSSALGG